jgi:hypothetical protein
MPRLVQGMHQGSGTRLHDISRSAVPGERLPIDFGLEKDLSDTVPSRRDRSEGETQDLHVPAEDLAHGGERRGDRTVAGTAGRALAGPRTGHANLGRSRHAAADHAEVGHLELLRRIVEALVQEGQ